MFVLYCFKVKLRACLVDCNRCCNIIVIPMVQLLFSLVIFLL